MPVIVIKYITYKPVISSLIINDWIFFLKLKHFLAQNSRIVRDLTRRKRKTTGFEGQYKTVFFLQIILVCRNYSPLVKQDNDIKWPHLTFDSSTSYYNLHMYEIDY